VAPLGGLAMLSKGANAIAFDRRRRHVRARFMDAVQFSKGQRLKMRGVQWHRLLQTQRHGQRQRRKRAREAAAGLSVGGCASG